MSTFQAITTKYLGPTSYRSSRVKATSASGRSITLAWDNALKDNHIAAARSLATKLNWRGHWYRGELAKGDSVFVSVTLNGTDDCAFTIGG
jgi:hypothetical protein